jgi:hypothetical protein
MTFVLQVGAQAALMEVSAEPTRKAARMNCLPME